MFPLVAVRVEVDELGVIGGVGGGVVVLELLHPTTAKRSATATSARAELTCCRFPK